MAAFTTSLLIGLALAGGAAGGAVAGKKMAGKTAPVTPGPTAADTLAVPPTPLTQSATSSSGVAAGRTAAQKQKRKAFAGMVKDTTSTLGAPAPKLKPQTLIGGGY